MEASPEYPVKGVTPVKNLSPPLSICLQTLFPRKHMIVHLIYGFSLILYLMRSELFLLPSSGWGALSHAVSGLFFMALSNIDWLIFQNPPILAVLTGLEILLIKFVYTFRKVSKEENIE